MNLIPEVSGIPRYAADRGNLHTRRFPHRAAKPRGRLQGAVQILTLPHQNLVRVVRTDQRNRRHCSTTFTATHVANGGVVATGSALGNVVLVHGAFVDGSTWRAVYDILAQDGYHVAVVQNPTLSLQGDAALTRLVVDAQDGPVVLVGHSYGGAVITEAGNPPRSRPWSTSRRSCRTRVSRSEH